MKFFLKIFIFCFLFIVPANAACKFIIDIGDRGARLFQKFSKPIPAFGGQFMLPIPSPLVCPDDNLNRNIAIEYIFLGDTPLTSNLAGIRMVVLNDGKNTESNKLTLMNYAKKVYGDFDTGLNPQTFNNFNIWKKQNNIIVYKRLFIQNLIDEEIFITNKEYDKKLAEFYKQLETGRK